MSDGYHSHHCPACHGWTDGIEVADDFICHCLEGTLFYDPEYLGCGGGYGNKAACMKQQAKDGDSGDNDHDK
jgi:hypothetical protein